MPRQALLDAALASYQPVHGLVQLVLIDATEVQQLAKGGDCGLWGEGAGGGKFGAGVDDAGDDHGDDQGAQTAGGAGDESRQVEVLEEAEDGGDVAMSEAAQTRESSVGTDQSIASEGAADEVDDGQGEMRDIAEGLMLDLALVAEGATEEVGAVGLLNLDTSDGT